MHAWRRPGVDRGPGPCGRPGAAPPPAPLPRQSGRTAGPRPPQPLRGRSGPAARLSGRRRGRLPPTQRKGSPEPSRAPRAIQKVRARLATGAVLRLRCRALEPASSASATGSADGAPRRLSSSRCAPGPLGCGGAGAPSAAIHAPLPPGAPPAGRSGGLWEPWSVFWHAPSSRAAPGRAEARHLLLSGADGTCLSPRGLVQGMALSAGDGAERRGWR